MDQTKREAELHPAVRYIVAVMRGAVEPYGDYFERLQERIESSAPLGARCG